jgi:hypothetical protein
MERSALDFRVRAYNLAAVKSPLAQMNVMPVETPILTAEESTLIPPGTVSRMGTRCLIAPYDRYGYRSGFRRSRSRRRSGRDTPSAYGRRRECRGGGDVAVDGRRYMTPQQTANAAP